MMISPVIVICILILVAYFFDLTSKFTKIPTVIFLLLLGCTVKQLVVFFDIYMPVLQPNFASFGFGDCCFNIAINNTDDVWINV